MSTLQRRKVYWSTHSPAIPGGQCPVRQFASHPGRTRRVGILFLVALAEVSFHLARIQIPDPKVESPSTRARRSACGGSTGPRNCPKWAVSDPLPANVPVSAVPARYRRMTFPWSRDQGSRTGPNHLAKVSHRGSVRKKLLARGQVPERNGPSWFRHGDHFAIGRERGLSAPPLRTRHCEYLVPRCRFSSRPTGRR